MKISIVIPCYNEAETIETIVQTVLAAPLSNLEIIIVDDGSKVHVDQLFDKYKNVKVIRNRFTRGQSYSLLSGIKNSNYDYICTLDADGQNPPSEIFKLISEEKIVQNYEEIPINIIAKASFGFGDINACVIFKKY